MEELYWITRIGTLSDILCLSAIISFVIAFCTGTFLLAYIKDYDPTSEWESDKTFAQQYDLLRKIWKVSMIVFIVTTVASTFVPSKKDLLIIYGGGTVIDFVQNDSIAKQIPHEAVEALHKYLTEE
ncbi:MAG: hypothetical protein MJZ41_07750 [Bacteroidaceae bacterium]|nr:hypothetical protein [Bacteroidaceae bacterium]